MSLRTKLVLSLVVLAAFSAVAIGVFSYRATARQLDAEINRSLDEAATTVLRRPLPRSSDADTPSAERRIGRDRFRALIEVELLSAQYVGPRGSVVVSTGDTELPVTPQDRALAAAETGRSEVRRDVDIDGVPHRVSTTSIGGGRGAVQIARSLADNDRILDRLRVRIIAATVAVVAVAAALGWILARQITERLRRLTATAETVAVTGRLDTAVPSEGVDEVGRLAGAFNRMLGALATSRADQRRLAEDAGHELRTPLTSLRTNIDVLRRHDDLDPSARAELLRDLDIEVRELSAMVDELVDLATDRWSDEPVAPVDLAEVVNTVAERARRRTGRSIEVRADSSAVDARRSSIERAVANLVDNALKFDDIDPSPVEVVLADGTVTVSDRGPGLDPEEIPRLFDRFHRAPAARSRPGSGLGLAIVADIVESHGGTVFASAREGGGAVVGFTLPPNRVDASNRALTSD